MTWHLVHVTGREEKHPWVEQYSQTAWEPTSDNKTYQKKDYLKTMVLSVNVIVLPAGFSTSFTMHLGNYNYGILKWYMQ